MKAQASNSFPARPWRGMTLADLLLICLTSAFLFGLCVARSRHHLLWSDEAYGYTLLSSPSYARMLRGWNAGADGGGIFYYLLCRPVFWMFHRSVLSLRLFSAAGVCTSLLLIWYAARPYYRTVAIVCGAALAYLRSDVMLWQDINGRFYGLFLAAAAFAVLTFVQASEQQKVNKSTYILTFLSHMLLVGSHILGMVYSAALIAGLVGSDLFHRRLRPLLYLSALAGWLVLPISYHAIVNSTSIATTSFWTIRPNTDSFLRSAFGYNPQALLAIVILAIAGVMLTNYRSQRNTPVSDLKVRTPIYATLASLYLAAMVLFLKSRFGISVFSDRYLLPENLAVVLLVPEFLTFAAFPLLQRFSHVFWSFFVGLCVLLPSFRAAQLAPAYAEIYSDPGYVNRMEQLLPPAETVVTTDPTTFTVLNIYDKNHKYVALTDWDYDLHHDDVQMYLPMERLMENWKRGGVEPNSIRTWDEVVSSLPRFALVVPLGRDSWFRARVLTNPAFHVRETGKNTDWGPLTIYEVTRTAR